MLTRHAITRRADKDGVDAAVVERDYVLAHIVAQLHRVRLSDGGRLVFKGGTALRLVHIGSYRYSADLDFTVIDASSDSAVSAMADVLEAARRHVDLPLLELTAGSSPVIEYIGPLEASKPRRIKVDISESEVVESVERRTILLDGQIYPSRSRSMSIPSKRSQQKRCAASSSACSVGICTTSFGSLKMQAFPSPISDRGSNARQRPKESTPHRSKSDSMIDWTGTRGVG